MIIPGGRKILVVDDEPSIRIALGRHLKARGYAPVVAADGEEALKRASEEEFEAVILDLMMPGISGLDVLRRIHADYPETAVIMLTAVAELTTAVEAMKLGAYDYMTKLFDLDGVLLKLERGRERRTLLLERRDYQARLERDVTEKTAHLDQKVQELNALNNMIQSRVNQVFAAHETYEQVAGAIREMATQMDGLAEAAKLMNRNEPRGNAGPSPLHAPADREQS